MFQKLITAAMLAIALASASASAQTQRPSRLEVQKTKGAPVKVDLGAAVTLNEKSSLVRDAYVIRDPAAPAKIVSDAAVNVDYNRNSRLSIDAYDYMWVFDVEVTEPIVAIEYRAHVFDVFGRLVRTLVGTKVQDVSATMVAGGRWRILTENEAAEHGMSVGYISSVRTAAGKVYTIDRSAVLERIRQVASNVSPADLEPPKRKTE